MLVLWICKFPYGFSVLIPKLAVVYSQWRFEGEDTGSLLFPTNNFLEASYVIPVPPLSTLIGNANYTFY